MSIKTYDPKQVAIDYAGILINSGFADGTFVKVERNEDTWTTKFGADGEAVRVKSNNKGGKVTLTLLQSSSANDLLSAQFLLDEATSQGVAPLSVTDVFGTSKYVAPNAWIAKPPAGEFAKDASSREWVIETDNMSMFAGGTLSAGI